MSHGPAIANAKQVVGMCRSCCGKAQGKNQRKLLKETLESLKETFSFTERDFRLDGSQSGDQCHWGEGSVMPEQSSCSGLKRVLRP